MVNQPGSIQTRLTRLEALFANMGETLAAHNDTIDVLVANISQLTENLNNLTEQTSRNIDNLALQAAEDRQQAAIDRQQAAIDRQQAAIDRQAWQAEIQRIWEYLLEQRGNGRQGT
ncbi:hypothetical protein NIES4071_03480 [Calothrix sp. NIES-4071]|nr:hypothetical protein NIES4071_03480 [Calothrix sp. NIES-4071]BAZ54694.1 hypothetical protein NIES4105_03470 [Calothrix sp. NIES-4105]